MEIEVQQKEIHSIACFVQNLDVSEVFIRKDIDFEEEEVDAGLDYFMRIEVVEPYSKAPSKGKKKQAPAIIRGIHTKGMTIPRYACVNLRTGLLYFFCEGTEGRG